MKILYNNSRSEDILRGQTKILNKIIDDEEMDVILTDIIFLLESLAPNMKSSIILLDEDGKRLGHTIAPSLPEVYVKAIVGLPIGPMAGSCGSAAYLHELIVVDDI